MKDPPSTFDDRKESIEYILRRFTNDDSPQFKPCRAESALHCIRLKDFVRADQELAVIDVSLCLSAEAVAHACAMFARVGQMDLARKHVARVFQVYPQHSDVWGPPIAAWVGSTLHQISGDDEGWLGKAAEQSNVQEYFRLSVAAAYASLTLWDEMFEHLKEMFKQNAVVLRMTDEVGGQCLVGRLLAALRLMTEGDPISSCSTMPPQLAGEDVEAALSEVRGAKTSISPRQLETLKLLVRGQSEKQIAAELGLSRHTVHGHIKELHRRLAVQNRAELLLEARIQALVP